MERPAVLGTQEVLAGQARVLRKALGRRYRRLGHGRNADGGGEGCPLYIDQERLDVLEWRQSALSDTPDVPGSRSWGNMVPRVLVSAILRDRATDATLLAMNTHLDHLSRRSRVRSAEMIRELVRTYGLPSIVMGDLNSGKDTSPVRELLAGGHLVDAWTSADVRLTPEWGTFTNYRAPRTGRKRIDWVMVSPDMTVECIGLNSKRPRGVWPSDHVPVQCVVRVR